MGHTIRVRVAREDIDALDHANNTAYIRWVQEAAVAHSTAVGFAVADYVARGQAFVLRRHAIDYLRPAFLDEELEVETRVTAMSYASSERHTLIRRARDGVALARSHTFWAYLDIRRGRPVRIPDEVRAAVTVEPMDPEGASQLSRRES